MDTPLLISIAVLAVLATAGLFLQIIQLFRSGKGLGPTEALAKRFDALERAQERAEKILRDESTRNREEAALHAKTDRQELQVALKSFGESLIKHSSEVARTQSEQMGRFSESLGKLIETNHLQMAEMRTAVTERLQTLINENGAKLNAMRDGFGQSAKEHREELASSLKSFNETLSGQVGAMASNTDKRMEALREVVDTRLKTMQAENARQLDQVRQTVDEKLQSTLEKRLGESFKLVSERLEQVHKGLGEMQTLATGVGDLQRVLTNVKTRGTWGEVQLEALLEQVLTPGQYEKNVATKGTAARVEFAIKLPGRDLDHSKKVWLPIDAKFPQEDYLRLMEAHEKADPAGVETAVKALDLRIRGSAKEICEKYLNPPHTTDFGILFLPTEGLYAEVMRKTGLAEAVQREHRVVIAGPSTLWALLNSLQVGFQTLAIEKRSSEVWKLLGAVKTEFGKYGTVLQSVRKKLQEASNTINTMDTRSRVMQQRLRNIHEEDGAEPIQLFEPEIPALPEETE